MAEISVVSLERLELRFAPRPWHFAQERRAEIDTHFANLRRVKPKLWNGRVLLLHEWAVTDKVFSGGFFETDFASFLAWTDWEWPDTAVTNAFAMAALRAADGAFLLGVMAAHTANAGKIYFPAGTPDPDDIRGDMVDLEESVMRELEEETGIGRGDVTPDPGWHAVLAGPLVALMKVVQSDQPAAALRARIRAHLARQTASELADMHVARRHSDLGPEVPPFVAAFLADVWR
jgi:NUDIX domain-containing protein